MSSVHLVNTASFYAQYILWFFNSILLLVMFIALQRLSLFSRRNGKILLFLNTLALHPLLHAL